MTIPMTRMRTRAPATPPATAGNQLGGPAVVGEGSEKGGNSL